MNDNNKMVIKMLFDVDTLFYGLIDIRKVFEGFCEYVRVVTSEGFAKGLSVLNVFVLLLYDIW